MLRKSKSQLIFFWKKTLVVGVAGEEKGKGNGYCMLSTLVTISITFFTYLEPQLKNFPPKIDLLLPKLHKRIPLEPDQ